MASRGPALLWFRSYLNEHSQHVSIDGFDSPALSISCGVPQGSILGPLLFLIYINDLNKCILNSKVHHFADDTNILYSNKSVKKISLAINSDLTRLSNWLRANKLSLNVKKTEIVIFRSINKEINHKYKFKIDGKKLDFSTSVKYLGLQIDEYLNWKEHISKLRIKLSRAVGILSKLRHFLPLPSLVTIYHALFSSHLTYGCQTWGQGQKVLLNKIQILQNPEYVELRFLLFTLPVTAYIKNFQS